MMYKIKQLLMKLGLSIGSLFKVENLIILESLPTMTDNAKAFYDYLIKHEYNKKYQIIWFSDKNCRDIVHDDNVKIVKVWQSFRHFSFIGLFKYFHYLKKAKYILYCNRGLHKVNRQSTTIFLNHGLPLKNVRDLKIVSPKVDWVICPSQFFQEMYVDQLHIPKEKILPLGSPRNDLMFDYHKTPKKFDFLTKSYDKVILWVPTFRDHSSYQRRDTTFNFPLGIPIIYDNKSLKSIDRYLKQRNILLLLKPHPVQDMSKITNINLENVKLITDQHLKDNQISLCEFLFYVDGILTDYSGIYYDALLTDKPIGFTIDDFKEYNETRGFPFDNPLEKMAGMKIKNLQELKKYIDDLSRGIDDYQKDREAVRKIFFDHLDSKACKRLIDYFQI